MLSDCCILKPNLFFDDRGYFFESWNRNMLNDKLGHEVNFIQDNESYSFKGVLRGLHYQKGASAQSKLVRVVQGKVQDVVVDIRKESPTFGEHISVLLSSENKKQLFVPRGFAHGFLTLSDFAILCYKCDNYYSPENEKGIAYDDPDLSIKWESTQVIVSDKDSKLNYLRDIDL